MRLRLPQRGESREKPRKPERARARENLVDDFHPLWLASLEPNMSMFERYRRRRLATHVSGTLQQFRSDTFIRTFQYFHFHERLLYRR